MPGSGNICKDHLKMMDQKYQWWKMTDLKMRHEKYGPENDG